MIYVTLNLVVIIKKKVCDDNDACTIDSCDPMSGCIFYTPDCLCNDNNACTTDSCEKYIGCINIFINCDDNDASTTDYCDEGAGCLHKHSDEY